MATHLDLEEQEQLDQFKHFWARWGNLITGLVTAVLLVYASYNGWNYWQQRQATQDKGPINVNPTSPDRQDRHGLRKLLVRSGRPVRRGGHVRHGRSEATADAAIARSRRKMQQTLES